MLTLLAPGKARGRYLVTPPRGTYSTLGSPFLVGSRTNIRPSLFHLYARNCVKFAIQAIMILND